MDEAPKAMEHSPSSTLRAQAPYHPLDPACSVEGTLADRWVAWLLYLDQRADAVFEMDEALAESRFRGTLLALVKAAHFWTGVPCDQESTHAVWGLLAERLPEGHPQAGQMRGWQRVLEAILSTGARTQVASPLAYVAAICHNRETHEIELASRRALGGSHQKAMRRPVRPHPQTP